MKYKFTLFIFSIILQITYGQNDSAYVHVQPNIKNVELSDYFYLIGAKSYSVILKDSLYFGHKIFFNFKEFNNSKLKKVYSTNYENPLLYSHTYYNTGSDSLVIRFMQIKKGRNKVRIAVNYPGMSTSFIFRINPKGLYDFRDILCKTDNYIVHFGIPCPILIYTTPFKVNNKATTGSYCILGFDGTPVEEWGKKYGLKHYIVVEILIK